MVNPVISRRAAVAALGATIAGAAPALVGCEVSTASAMEDSGLSGSITAVGSTAMQPLVEAAAEEYMASNKGVQITVQGGGSGQGITQVSDGAVQIGDSDVFAEKKLDDDEKLSRLVDNRVAVVGMGPVVNSACGVEALSMDQLRDIFFGLVTNWSEVGGADQDIVVINRAAGSGTRATFEAAVFGDEVAPSTFVPQEQDSSGTVSKMVADTPGAISYLAFTYFSKRFTALTIDGVAPTIENVETGAWDIWAYQHMYVRDDADEVTRSFIDFMFSDYVQTELVEDCGYISVAGMQVEKDAAGEVTRLS
jgi:phosphate transport system substrate-binding protein